jgi:hypothetical protein
MKYIILILLACTSVIEQAGQDSYSCKNARIGLFSSTPVDDIKAETSTGVSTFDASTGELAFSVNIKSLTFEKSLMQQHFNDDYMQSDKYPTASFKGKIQEHIDVAKEGTYPVTVAGGLTIHGVTKPRTIPGKVIIKAGTITMTSEFLVKCEEHNVETPKILFHHIAKEVTISVSATYKK